MTEEEIKEKTHSTMTLNKALEELVEAVEEHLSDYGYIPDYSDSQPPAEYVEALKIVKQWLKDVKAFDTIMRLER